MKWRIKRELWQSPTHQARYKNNLLTISEKTEGFSKKLLGYYFTVAGIKNDKRYNSLWQEKWFTSLDDAKQAAVDYVNDLLREGKSNGNN